jgi:hypothetical protein
MTINLLTTPEKDVEAAFDLIEGNGFYARSKADTFGVDESIGAVLNSIKFRREEFHIQPNGRAMRYLRINGFGGWRRYFVDEKGTVFADPWYGIDPKKAIDVGFDIRQ